jgi:hypothetical protein
MLADGMPKLAEVMDRVSVIRSVVSREGDHERATYNMKTGYRPDPSLVHPSLGAVICHEIPDVTVEIPRHVSIFPGQWPARGGYFGDAFDAFKIFDPQNKVPDLTPRVKDKRQDRRLSGLDVVEAAFARGRRKDLDKAVTQHQDSIDRALKMMTSEQVKAFDVSECTAAERAAYGDTPFGRGCLAARRLIEVGVRCVEVTLNGWDTHVNNHELQNNLIAKLDPAFAALITDLSERKLLDSTAVLCGGEFGRTPRINPAAGRDHWPHAFSVALAGGGFHPGRVLGETDPTGEKKEPARPVRVRDIHASVMHALGIDPYTEIMTPVGRPMELSKGRLIKELLG